MTRFPPPPVLSLIAMPLRASLSDAVTPAPPSLIAWIRPDTSVTLFRLMLVLPPLRFWMLMVPPARPAPPLSWLSSTLFMPAISGLPLVVPVVLLLSPRSAAVVLPLSAAKVMPPAAGGVPV